MTLSQFITKYRGKYLDFDKVYGAQCVDLTKAYYKEVLGIAPKIGNAVTYWTTIDSRFTRIANTPRAIPRAGDVVVWGTKYGKYGHVAVATGNGNVWWFDAFSQNDPLGSPCKIKRYYMYRGVLGWLRKK
jgi:cell wall-associated NlpC family hydrolase